MNQLPSEFRPQTAEDFIGPARRAAIVIDKTLAMALPNNAPLTFLIWGESGTGKSSLAAYIAKKLGIGKWSLYKKNGADVGVELIRDWEYQAQLRDIFSGYKLFWIDEVDRSSPPARARMHTLVDDLPPGNILVCTSNKRKDEFDEPFLRRFMQLELPGPTPEEIAGLLQRLTPAGWVPEKHAPALAKRIAGIATLACGNVGLAIKELEQALACFVDTAAIQKAA